MQITYGQCTCNDVSRRVRVTVFAIGTQNTFPFYSCWRMCSGEPYESVHCCYIKATMGSSYTVTKYCILLSTIIDKAVPLQAWSGPEGSRKLRFPDFVTTAQDGGKVISLTHRLSLPPGNGPGTHFC